MKAILCSDKYESLLCFVTSTLLNPSISKSLLELRHTHTHTHTSPRWVNSLKVEGLFWFCFLVWLSFMKSLQEVGVCCQFYTWPSEPAEGCVILHVYGSLYVCSRGTSKKDSLTLGHTEENIDLTLKKKKKTPLVEQVCRWNVCHPTAGVHNCPG